MLFEEQLIVTNVTIYSVNSTLLEKLTVYLLLTSLLFALLHIYTIEMYESSLIYSYLVIIRKAFILPAPFLTMSTDSKR